MESEITESKELTGKEKRLKNLKPFPKGVSGNPGGRPKNPLKEFSLKEFQNWDDEKKREFLKKVTPIDRWKMTEGSPDSKTDITSGGEQVKAVLVKFLDGKDNRDTK